MANFPIQDDLIVLKIPLSDSLEERDYIGRALMDAIENRKVDPLTEIEQYQNTTYCLMQLLKAVIF